MLDAGENSSSSSCFLSSLNVATSNSGRKKSRNRRRFSDDQIRLMEGMFENETKLEPKKKLELARELGLQPRQVAIWFQNKRARCKSKQLERDYDLLSSNYQNLASQFESLKKENHSLLLQLKNLNELIDESEKEGKDRECGCRREASDAGNSSGLPPGVSKISSNIESSAEMDVKPSLSLERSEYGVVVDDGDDESSRNPDYNLGISDQEAAAAELMNMVEAADSCLTSPGEWGSCFDSDVWLDKPSCSYQRWWDFYKNY